MNKIPLISIIVPVYNVEKYLDKCLNSIVNQTYENIEILVINDGSTDNSEEVIKKYLDNPKIKYFKKENGGIANTRNFGIKNAKGDYLGWVDSDDWIDDSMFEELLNISLEKNSDFVISGARRVNQCGQITEEYIPKEASLKEVMYKGYFWNKLISRNLYLENNVLCKEDEVFEDVGTICYLFLNSKNPVITNKIYYNYFTREGSITKTRGVKQLDILKQYIRLKKYLTEHNMYDKYEADYKWSCNYLKNMFMNSFSNDSIEFIIKYYTAVVKYFKKIDSFTLRNHLDFLLYFVKNRIRRIVRYIFNLLGIDIKKVKSILKKS